MYLTGSELTHIIATYGYFAVLLFVFIESMGIPFPGETMLILAGIYAGTTQHLNIVLVIVAAAAGAILGDNAGFAIGRYGGYALLRRYGHYVHLNERELKLGQYLFMRHGGKVVFFGRFVSVLRAWAAFLAGVDQMAWPKFLAYNAAGGILWATLYGTAAYVLGNAIHRVAGKVGIGIGVAAGLIIVAFFIYVRRNYTRLADEAEHALPGPLDRHRSRRSHGGALTTLEARADGDADSVADSPQVRSRDGAGHTDGDAGSE